MTACTVADPECAKGGGVSQILARKRVLASLYSKKCMKIQYFHEKRGGRTPGTPYAGPATAVYKWPIKATDSAFNVFAWEASTILEHLNVNIPTERMANMKVMVIVLVAALVCE